MQAFAAPGCCPELTARDRIDANQLFIGVNGPAPLQVGLGPADLLKPLSILRPAFASQLIVEMPLINLAGGLIAKLKDPAIGDDGGRTAGAPRHPDARAVTLGAGLRRAEVLARPHDPGLIQILYQRMLTGPAGKILIRPYVTGPNCAGAERVVRA